MELVRGLYNFAKPGRRGTGDRLADRYSSARGCVLTIGNYDGVHRGHQRMIDVLKHRAEEFRCASTVLVFEPSSKEFIDPSGAPPRLTRWREKVVALDALGVDRLVTLRFDDDMRAMSPQCFVEQLIVQGLAVRHMVVGDDFRYGTKAEGTIESLREAGKAHGFSVEQIAPFIFEGKRVSSTAVRECLEAGNYPGAARLLGHRYRMMGRVVRGAALGRTMGFPTANLRLGRRKSPLWGVSAVRVHGIESHPLDAVASLGTRPTVNGIEPLLEVHVFDFAGDLYGQPLEVEFIAKLRDEVRFDTLDLMMTQMRIDAASARDVLSKVTCD